MYGTTYTQEGWERRWTILANVAHFLSRNTRDDEGGKEERGVMAFARSGRSLSLSLTLLTFKKFMEDTFGIQTE